MADQLKTAQQQAEVFLRQFIVKSEQDEIHRKFREYALEGNLDAITELYNREKIQIDSVSQYGQSALHFAAMRGHESIARFLLSKGANAQLKDTGSLQQTPVDFAYANGHFFIAGLIDPKQVFIKTGDNKSFTYDPEQHLFKVTTSGGSFYLLGTQHDANFQKLVQKTPDIMGFLQTIEHFISETNEETDDPGTTAMVDAFKAVWLKDTHKTVYDFLNIPFLGLGDVKQKYQGYLERLSELLRTELIGSIDNLPPWLIFLLPGLLEELDVSFRTVDYSNGIDTQLACYCKEHKKHSSILETFGQRFEIAKEVSQKLSYSQLAKWMKTDDPMEEFLLPFADARNKMWIDKLLSRDQAELNNSLVYCGLAHLYGNNGLIELLRAKKFTVTKCTFAEAVRLKQQPGPSPQ